MAEAAQLFSKKADVYRSGRTHYPKAIASILRELELPGNKAVDAGCGTGIFSQMLLDCGFFVYGVEPNAEMLCAAKEQLHCSQFVPIQSTAEAIPLPDHSVDFICPGRPGLAHRHEPQPGALRPVTFPHFLDFSGKIG